MSPAVHLPAPEVFVRGRAIVGEGPVVDDRTAELVWVDIPSGVLTRTALAGGGPAAPVARVGMSLGAVAVRRNGGYAAAVDTGFGLIGGNGAGVPADAADGEDGGAGAADPTLSVVHPVLPDAERRMNDAKCDAAGRFWAGSTTYGFPEGGGALHCWDPAGDTVRTVVSGLTLPNGLGWSPDGQRFYLADSVLRAVFTADFDPAEGNLGPLRELLRLDASDGMPDGLCVDQDGCLWIALWGAGQVRRYDPHGACVAVLPMPVSQPSSCAFGPDGTLYVTSACDGVPEGEEPLAGSVFALPATRWRGVPVGTFAG
ncbi:SMP-30/gluconolactonase/LRE family protein [Streptomyces sp. NPDC020917]|uniref:SMP-30/gluconolactonase/LRE family protein n=1 Tax=Streptomyces sp. NPDC020917 TaxID=3365102 RepID=UPI0037B00FF9